jgi:hypothetical protein
VPLLRQPIALIYNGCSPLPVDCTAAFFCVTVDLQLVDTAHDTDDICGSLNNLDFGGHGQTDVSPSLNLLRS